MKTKKISKGLYKGIYKGFEISIISSYDWRGVLQTWIGRVLINGSEFTVYEGTKKHTIEELCKIIDNK